MNNQGQLNYKGINAQAWAAMSLFLQYLRDPNVSKIELEAAEFQDFNLVFNDGHKIICESKAWKKEFGFSHLRKILKDILNKITIGEKDEILIICVNLNKELENKIKYIKYWSEKLAIEFRKRKFTNQQIAILDKVKFWKVQQKDNHLIVYALFSELLAFWLPENELECKADSILIKRIYEGSAKGKVYKREDIINEIESMRKKASKYSGYFDDERVKTEDQLQNLIKALDNNKAPEWAPNQLSALTSKPALMSFALDRIKDKKIDKLADWSDLWELYKIYRFSFTLFRIFEDNLHTAGNKKYILQFFKNNISEIRRFYQRDFFDVDVIKITKNILKDDKNNKFINDAFEIVKKLITEKKDDIFYLKEQQDSLWERNEIAKLLHEIYKKSNTKLKKGIFNLIINTFNLVKDDGQFSHYTPLEIFGILGEWLETDFKKRLPILIKILSKQFACFYKKFGSKLEFQGWEHMGSGISGWEHNFTISDRHFISYILKPVINEQYNKSKNKEKMWNFIFKHCVSNTDEVSAKRPDFLNRAVLAVILRRYQNSNKKISDEAFNILSEFILSKKGIPHKSDLIYQALLGYDISDDKKLKLVKISIDKYKTPINVFVEQIISSLIKKGNKAARTILVGWFDNPKYYERIRFDSNIIQNIKDALEANFNFGIKLFNNFINSNFFINQYDSFEVYEFAKILHSILVKKFKVGIEILIGILKTKKLSKNQQILLCHSLLQKPDQYEKDKKETLIRIYNKFIDPLLKSWDNNIHTIYKIIWHSNAREIFVQFAEKLAINKEIEKALRIVEVFIDDPDPYLPNKNSEDPENKYNEHQCIENGEKSHLIRSVRGWCAWVLMKCSVLAGHNYIGQIIDQTEQLTKDKNWYVKHMACFALSQLAQARLTVMPDDKEILFFGKDKKKALTRAKKVEDIAFNLLEDISKASANVKKALAESIPSVFNHIRALNEDNVLKFLKLIKKFPGESIAEASPLLIFFAEFRKESFKDWKWAIPGHYDYLRPDQYNSEKIRKEVFKIIDNLKPEERFSFGASCERMIRENNPGSEDKNAEKYYKIACKYLNHISNDYHENTFRIIYDTIQEGMQKNWHFNKWQDLYFKCLKIENRYYQDHLNKDNVMQMYWWPYYENSKILQLIYNHGNKKEFLDALEIIVNFPKEMDIHATEDIIALLEKFSNKNKQVKNIINKLFEKNPSKYYEFKRQYSKKK